MLWVFKRIVSEAEAIILDLPKEIDEKTHQYPHGLTAPMYDARKRRFRKRISRTAIEAVEDAVEKLLEADARADSTRYDMIRIRKEVDKAVKRTARLAHGPHLEEKSTQRMKRTTLKAMRMTQKIISVMSTAMGPASPI